MTLFTVRRSLAVAVLALGGFAGWGCQHATPPTTASTHEEMSAPHPSTAAPTVATPAAATAQGADDFGYAALGQQLLDEPARRVVKLANGVTVILQQNPTAPVVACRIYIKAGSLTEQEFMGVGISHVLEHLVAGASSKQVKEAQSQQMLRILGGDSNAFTSFDQTCYFITTTAEKWPSAMELLSNWVTGADFTKEQFAREYQVVQRELEMGEAEAARTFDKMIYATRYLVFPARHPVIGYKPAFQKVTWENCRDYYARMYVPDNMIVSIAGDINLDVAQHIVQRNFAHVERKKVPAISLPQEPAVAAPRTTVGHADVKEARACWAFASVDMQSPDMYPLDVLADVLGAGESSVLVRRLRDEKGLVTGIGSADDTPSWGPGSFQIVAQLPPEKIMPAQQEVLNVLGEVLKKGVDPKEVEKAKVEVAARFVYGNQTAEQQAERNAEDFLALGNIDAEKIYVDEIKKVTPERVNEAARRYIKPDMLLTTILLPLKTSDSVAGMASASGTVAHKEAVTKTVLPNGLTVLINRNPSSPLVTMQMYTLGALLAENDSNNGVGNAMMELMGRGTNSRTHDQVTEFFDSTGGSLETSMANNAFMVKATCLKENAGTTFDLFADVILHPAFAGDELDKIRPQLLAAIDQSTEDWFGEGYKFLRENYYQNSPYKRLPVGTAAVVSKLTPEQIRSHYEKYFMDPSRTVLAIYGDMDPAQALQWARQFSVIPANVPDLAMTSVASAAKTATQTSSKGSASVFIGYGPGMKANSPDIYPMIVLKTILGGYNSPGGSVLHETLRGKGLVYVVQASNVAGPVPGMFLVMALGEPKNAPEIVRLITQIIDQVKAGNFTDDEIRTAQDQAITGEQIEGQTIGDQAADQALDELMGLGYDARAHFAENIRKVTKEDMIRVAKKYLQNPVVTITTPSENK